MLEFRCQTEERVDDRRGEVCELAELLEPRPTAVGGTETSLEKDLWASRLEVANGDLINSFE